MEDSSVEQPIKMTITKLSSVSGLSDVSQKSEGAKTHMFNVKDIEVPVINFKNLKGYKDKEKGFKMNVKKDLIISKIKEALSAYEFEEKKYNTEIVLFVCQCVEDLLAKPKSGKDKAEIVKAVCAEYFDGKEELVMMVIDLIYGKIVKSTFYRRNANKIRNVGTNILKSFFGIFVGSIISK